MIDFINANVLDWCRTYKGSKFHAILADPPYSLGDGEKGFMGKRWDNSIAFQPETWEALAEHLHDGAFIMAFSGARTYHRMACAIEDAGFVLHSMVGFCYGSGFPKAARVKDSDLFNGHRYGLQALKPAMEPICIAQKPYSGRPVDCITQTGAGALNIDSARIGSADNLARLNRDGDNGWKNSSGGPNEAARREAEGLPQLGRWPANFVLSHSADCEYVGVKRVKGGNDPRGKNGQIYQAGQFQDNGGFKNGYESNHSGYADADGYETVQEWRCSESCPVRLLGEQSGELKSGAKTRNKVDPIPTGGKYGIYGDWEALCDGASFQGDTGTAARFFFNADFSLDQQEAIDNAAPFFYAAKASSKERSAGLEDMVQLRKDLTDDERAYVMAELAKVGLYDCQF